MFLPLFSLKSHFLILIHDTFSHFLHQMYPVWKYHFQIYVGKVYTIHSEINTIQRLFKVENLIIFKRFYEKEQKSDEK
jgi:hypothetical protein